MRQATTFQRQRADSVGRFGMAEGCGQSNKHLEEEDLYDIEFPKNEFPGPFERISNFDLGSNRTPDRSYSPFSLCAQPNVDCRSYQAARKVNTYRGSVTEPTSISGIEETGVIYSTMYRNPRSTNGRLTTPIPNSCASLPCTFPSSATKGNKQKHIVIPLCGIAIRDAHVLVSQSPQCAPFCDFLSRSGCGNTCPRRSLRRVAAFCHMIVTEASRVWDSSELGFLVGIEFKTPVCSRVRNRFSLQLLDPFANPKAF